jgi:SAM-dependent methyltransferase
MRIERLVSPTRSVAKRIVPAGARRAARSAGARMIPQALRPAVVSRLWDTTGHPQWLRAVLTPDTRREFEALGPARLDVAEISGDLWGELPWRTRQRLEFPEFDLCRPPDPLPGPFDLVICEQVLEHVVDPLTAVRTLKRLCRPGGYVYVATPFLVRLHGHPADYWRFTPRGLCVLLRSQGLEPVWVRSWGNRKVAVANFTRWVSPFPWQTLRNEPQLPVVVWALARPREPPAAVAHEPLG